MLIHCVYRSVNFVHRGIGKRRMALTAIASKPSISYLNRVGERHFEKSLLIATISNAASASSVWRADANADLNPYQFEAWKLLKGQAGPPPRARLRSPGTGFAISGSMSACTCLNLFIRQNWLWSSPAPSSSAFPPAEALVRSNNTGLSDYMPIFGRRDVTGLWCGCFSLLFAFLSQSEMHLFASRSQHVELSSTTSHLRTVTRTAFAHYLSLVFVFLRRGNPNLRHPCPDCHCG